jgi:hypothetical protein
MTAQDSAKTSPSSTQRSVFLNGQNKVLATCRFITTILTQQRTDAALIKSHCKDHRPTDTSRQRPLLSRTLIRRQIALRTGMIGITRMPPLSNTEVLTRAISRRWKDIMLFNTALNCWLIAYQLAIVIEMV